MTKKDQIKKCQDIRDSCGGTVTSSDDFNFLIELFKRHPEWEHKHKGLQITQIKVRRADKFGTRGFYIIREDNTETDISFITCINGKPTPKQEIERACRTDNSTVTYFTDETIIQDFIQYHNAHTHLRPVHKTVNQSILKKKIR